MGVAVPMKVSTGNGVLVIVPSDPVSGGTMVGTKVVIGVPRELSSIGVGVQSTRIN